MTPGISFLRKSLRYNAPAQFNRDRVSHESKPTTNARTVSSPKLPNTCEGPLFNESHGFQGNGVGTVKRCVSQDVTLETETDSVDVKSNISSDILVRRLSSSSSGGSTKYLSRRSSIQDDLLNQEQDEEKREIDTSGSTSVSSLTLESFHGTQHVPTSRSRSLSRNRRSPGSAAHSLERIGEDTTTISSCSKFTEEAPVSLTLSDLQNTVNSVRRGTVSVTSESDNKSRSCSEGKLDLSKLAGGRRARSCSVRAPSIRGKSSKDSYSSARSTSIPSQEQLRRSSKSEQRISSTDSLSTQTVAVISSLHEKNLEKEETISRLEQERDSMRRIMQVMRNQQTELQSQLKTERQGFASMTSVHEKEVKEWMDKASSLSSKVLDLEQVARIRDQDDEVRSERISNLERNVVKLLYSSRVFKVKQCKTAPSVEDENNVIKQNCVDQHVHASHHNDESPSKISQLEDEHTLLVERCQELEALKEENRHLIEATKKTVDDLKSKNLELEEALAVERNACQYLREEAKNASCKNEQVKESSASDHPDVSSCLDLKDQELKEKNDTIQTVAALMSDLMAEQQSIKETVVALRMENLKLRGADTESSKEKQASPSPSPPPGTMALKEKAKFESLLNGLEKENKGLKEAVAALSTKLMKEMENTESLQLANEALAAKICKLVTVIKEKGKH